MEVLKLILENIDNIAAVVIMFIIVIALVKKGETDVLKEILFSLITRAEGEFGAGAGVLKFATVADWLYERIPSMLKPLFTSKDIEKLIEDALTKAKAEWEENPGVYEMVPQKDDSGDSSNETLALKNLLDIMKEQDEQERTSVQTVLDMNEESSNEE